MLLGYAQSADLVILKSRQGGIYDEAVAGLTSELERQGYQLVIQTLVLKGDRSDPDIVRTALTRKPKLLVAVGNNAVQAIQQYYERQPNQPKVPVVFTMVLDPVGLGLNPEAGSKASLFTGVELSVRPQRMFRALLDVHSQVKTIGLLYNPDDPTSRRLVAQAEDDAKRMELQLVAAPLRPNESLQGALQSLQNKIDAFMLIPDPVCASPEPFNQILAFTTEQKIPLIAFADTFVRRGALLGLGIDFREQGILGAELVARVLEGGNPASLPIQSPRKYLIYYNLRQAKALNLTIPEMLLNLADKVFEQ